MLWLIPTRKCHHEVVLLYIILYYIFRLLTPLVSTGVSFIYRVYSIRYYTQSFIAFVFLHLRDVKRLPRIHLYKEHLQSAQYISWYFYNRDYKCHCDFTRLSIIIIIYIYIHTYTNVLDIFCEHRCEAAKAGPRTSQTHERYTSPFHSHTSHVTLQFLILVQGRRTRLQFWAPLLCLARSRLPLRQGLTGCRPSVLCTGPWPWRWRPPSWRIPAWRGWSHVMISCNIRDGVLPPIWVQASLLNTHWWIIIC